MSTLWQDVRYGFRMLCKAPGFTAIALITLAIGIGANTIMFSVVNVLVLRPVHVKDPDQLVGCKARNAYGNFPYSAFVEMRENNPAFSDMMAYDSGFEFVTLVRRDATRRAYAMYVSANYFSFLGVAPARGRTFSPEEEQYGAEPVVVLNHSTWKRQGADPNVVGTQVAINGTLFRIVGITPERFTGTTVIGPDLWLPLGTYGLVGHLGWDKPERMSSEVWNYPDIMPVGRLKPGLSIDTAQAQLQSLVPRLKENNPRWWPRSGTLGLSRLPRLSAGSGDDRTFLSGAGLFLMSVSAVVLLVACLNLANMAIIQGTARQREIAIRMAIGGGRLRIMRQLLVESLLLAMLGGAMGLALAFWGTRILNAWVGALQFPIALTDSARMGIDLRVLAATLGFCLIATVLSGLRPALRLSRREVIADLKQSRGEVLRSTGRVRRPRSLSVVVQIALSVVLVMGAALFTRSALRTAPADSGFSLDDKLLVEIDTLSTGYDLVRSRQVYESLTDRLRSMPGVQAVSLSASFPLADVGSGGSVREYTPGAEKDQRDEEEVMRDLFANSPTETSTVYAVGVDYFEAMGMPLLQGRTFHRLDSVPDAEKVVIIGETLARKLRPDGNALGCLVQYGWRPSSSSPSRVVGIVPSLRIVTDNDFNPTQIYVPMGPDCRPVFIHLCIASKNHATETALLQQIPTEIRKVDPHLPIISVITMAAFHRNNPFVWLWGFGARLAVLFGAMALFLASLGIYAVKGYMVASRTPEIGIRMALGATHKDIMGMVFCEGTVLTLAGLVVGLLLGLGAARLIASLLYGVGPVDPVSIAVAVVLLGAASLLAGYIPARRAAKIDPMDALRYE